jgi:TPR repeat protein
MGIVDIRKILFIALLLCQSVCYADLESARGLLKKDRESGHKELRLLAEKGDTEAQCLLVFNLPFDYGNVVEGHEARLNESARWAKIAYESGKAVHSCQIQWAGYLQTGTGGVNKDSSAAARVYEKGAALGNPESQYYLAHLYLSGDGVVKDEKKAVQLIKDSVNQDFYGAIQDLALWYFIGFESIPQDYQQSAKLFQKRLAMANNGVESTLDPNDLYWLGLINQAGWNEGGRITDSVKSNMMAAFNFKKAISLWDKYSIYEAKNYSSAAINLGLMYKDGGLGEVDKKQACGWFKVAADNVSSQDVDTSSSAGMVQLSMCYSTGGGLEKNSILAVQWERKAAEAGDSVGQFYLGLDYIGGDNGLQKDYIEAYKWLSKSATPNPPYTPLGLSSAQYFLGTLYDDGLGVPRDYAKAVEWYKKASEQNDSDAQNKLGAKFAEGSGVKKDLTQALKWFTIAAANGNEKGKDNRDKAEKLLSKSDIKKAQTQASEWMKVKSGN